MYSALGIVWYRADICLQENEEYSVGSIQFKKIAEIHHSLILGSDCFLWKFEYSFNSVKSKFCYQMPSKPFHIMIVTANSFGSIVREIRKMIEESEEEREEEETEELSNPLPIEMHPPNHNFTGPGTLLTRLLNSKEEEQILKIEKTFKSEECVICCIYCIAIADICVYA